MNPLIPTIVLSAIGMLMQFLMPLLSTILPINKEIVRVRSLNDSIDQETQYPVLDFIGLVERHEGYTAEEYNVTTSDGYILRLHRITGSPNKPMAPGKPVVYLQHGIGLSSDSWVLIGPGKDLAFLLADAEKDVWIGNVRGNTYSRSHVSKSPSDDDFWNFSYHDMGREDLKSFIDFALQETGAENLTYVGFSMGTTMSYVLLSERPEYNEKISIVYSLAPVVFWRHEFKRQMKIMDSLMGYLREYFAFFNTHEILTPSAVGAYIGEQYCGDNSIVTQPLCILLFSNIGLDPIRLNKTALPEILAHYPAGTSVINIYHYNDNYKRNAFQAYDYGAAENERRYGSANPPVYNLSKVTAPVTMWFASADDIVNEEDVFELAEYIPNAKTNRVDHPKFNHFDFLWAQDVKPVFYDKLNLY